MHRTARRLAVASVLAALLGAAAARRAAAQAAAWPSDGWMGYVAGTHAGTGFAELLERSLGGSAALLHGTGTALEYGVEASYEQAGPRTDERVLTFCRGDAPTCQPPCTPGSPGCIEERSESYVVAGKLQLLGVVRLHATRGVVRPYAETGMGPYGVRAHTRFVSVVSGDPDFGGSVYEDRPLKLGVALVMGAGLEVPLGPRVALLAGGRLTGHLGTGVRTIYFSQAVGVRLQ
ncbi:MAG TPA: hypothetical protein VFS40_01100 [Gemmatimonadales bacterium]|nr:hypothetical protein [Gemmatimonadales bacterium]